MFYMPHFSIINTKIPLTFGQFANLEANEDVLCEIWSNCFKA